MSRPKSLRGARVFGIAEAGGRIFRSHRRAAPLKNTVSIPDNVNFGEAQKTRSGMNVGNARSRGGLFSSELGKTSEKVSRVNAAFLAPTLDARGWDGEPSKQLS
jgi:hypothetical protein